MPIFRSTATTPKVRAISGMAVAITVASRFSMKKVTATNKAISVDWRCDIVGSSGERGVERAGSRQQVAHHRITDHRFLPRLDRFVFQVDLENLGKGMAVRHAIETERTHQHVQVNGLHA